MIARKKCVYKTQEHLPHESVKADTPKVWGSGTISESQESDLMNSLRQDKSLMWNACETVPKLTNSIKNHSHEWGNLGDLINDIASPDWHLQECIAWQHACTESDTIMYSSTTCLDLITDLDSMLTTTRSSIGLDTPSNASIKIQISAITYNVVQTPEFEITDLFQYLL